MTQENLLLREDGYPHLPLPEVKQYNCNYCGDSGDVHRADGEWLGQCSCAAGLEITIEALRQENEKLKNELETERMRLAACGVAALVNTEESAKNQRIAKDNIYYSASYHDVCRAVDSEISLRKKNKQLRQQVSNLKVALSDFVKYAEDVSDDSIEFDKAKAALKGGAA